MYILPLNFKSLLLCSVNYIKMTSAEESMGHLFKPVWTPVLYYHHYISYDVLGQVDTFVVKGYRYPAQTLSLSLTVSTRLRLSWLTCNIYCGFFFVFLHTNNLEIFVFWTSVVFPLNSSILTREPLIFVFYGPSGIRKTRVPAWNFLRHFFISHLFKTFKTLFHIRYTNFQTTWLSIWLSHINGCRMTRAFW